MPPGGGEIYVEFVVHGNVVKVTAIDPQTGLEAIVMGPAGAPRASMSDAAVRKLRYVLQKKVGGGA
jgi:hypothetical protein